MAPGGYQQPLRPHHLAAVQAHRELLAGMAHLRGGHSGTDVDVLAREHLGEQVTRLRLVAGQQPGVGLHHRDSRPEPGEDLGELAAHRPTAEHDHRLEYLLGGYRFPVGPVGRAGQPVDRGHRRLGARVEHDPSGRAENPRTIRGGHGDLARCGDLPPARTNRPPAFSNRWTATVSSQLSVASARIRSATGAQSGRTCADPANCATRRPSASASAGPAPSSWSARRRSTGIHPRPAGFRHRRPSGRLWPAERRRPPARPPSRAPRHPRHRLA